MYNEVFWLKCLINEKAYVLYLILKEFTVRHNLTLVQFNHCLTEYPGRLVDFGFLCNKNRKNMLCIYADKS